MIRCFFPLAPPGLPLSRYVPAYSCQLLGANELVAEECVTQSAIEALPDAAKSMIRLAPLRVREGGISARFPCGGQESCE